LRQARHPQTILLAAPPSTLSMLGELAQRTHLLFKPLSAKRLHRQLGLSAPAITAINPLPSWKGTRALAVDDNPANLQLIHALLSDMDVQVYTANSGKAAVAIASQQPLDIIFMDIQMPEVDGRMAAQQIRALPEHAHTPIIALTAHALPEEKRELLDNGFQAHLAKPVSEAQLHETLAQHLEQPGTAVSAPVDIALCLERANGKPLLARDMLVSLLSILPAERADIARYGQSRDHNALLETVHRLHGGCCYTGVPGLKAASEALESALKQHPGADHPTAITAVLQAMDHLQSWAEGHDIDVLFSND
jgi:two-component system sensor histidine kinase BarA